MPPTNGVCQHPSHSEAGSRIAGVLGPKPKIEQDYETDPQSLGNPCHASMLRAKPAEILDLVGTGRTVEIIVDYAPAGTEPIAVVMPWAQYRELITMRDRAAAIFGGFQPGR